MQNISLTKLANAIRKLECENITNESYKNLVSQHETKLQNIYSEIQKIQSNKSNEKIISDLTNSVNELKSRSINDNNEEELNKLQNQVQNLKDDILKVINDAPVLTYDEKNTDISEDSLSDRQFISTSEFKAPDTNESKYSEYSSLDDVLQIKLGDTQISINKDENNREICSITNEVGGLAFRKQSSDDVWLLDRNKNSEMEFHFNTMDNIPFSINPNGIKVPKISLNGKTISNVANSINNETINDKTIPTVSAIVKYINTNLQRMNLINILNESNGTKHMTDIEKSDAQNTIPVSSTNVPLCNISTVKTDKGHSLLIENESNSFTLKDSDNNLISISASLNDGLNVGNTFKLNNTKGILCKFNDNNGKLSVGKFVELTGSVIKINDLIVPEVRLTNKLTTMVYGIINSHVQHEFIKSNKIYKLDNDNFVTVVKKGFIEIPVEEGSFELGSLLVAGKDGSLTYNKNNADAIKFCVNKKIPMAKIISKINENLVVEIV